MIESSIIANNDDHGVFVGESLTEEQSLVINNRDIYGNSGYDILLETPYADIDARYNW